MFCAFLKRLAYVFSRYLFRIPPVSSSLVLSRSNRVLPRFSLLFLLLSLSLSLPCRAPCSRLMSALPSSKLNTPSTKSYVIVSARRWKPLLETNGERTMKRCSAGHCAFQMAKGGRGEIYADSLVCNLHATHGPLMAWDGYHRA